MVDLLVVTTLLHQSGFEEDNILNTYAFHFPVEELDGDQLDLVTASMFGAYETSLGGTDKLMKFIHQGIPRGTATFNVKLYDITEHLDGSPHGGPIFEENFIPITASAGTSLPEEVAVCLTTRAVDWDLQAIEVADGADPDSAPDRPRQRYSGRIYYGPLNSLATTLDVANHTRVSPAVKNTLLEVGQFMASWPVDEGGNWCIWSRKDAVLRRITRIEVDNALDTVRRRGPRATERYNAPTFIV